MDTPPDDSTLLFFLVHGSYMAPWRLYQYQEDERVSLKEQELIGRIRLLEAVPWSTMKSPIVSGGTMNTLQSF